MLPMTKFHHSWVSAVRCVYFSFSWAITADIPDRVRQDRSELLGAVRVVADGVRSAKSVEKARPRDA